MSKSRRSLARTALNTLSHLWKRREQDRRHRTARETLLVEALESRTLMASDLSTWFASNAGALDYGPVSSPAPTAESSFETFDVAPEGEGTEAPDLVAFAKALSDLGVKFFGAAWCPHCTAQKELFQDGAKYLPFIEVTNPDRTPNATGIANNITTYPTWEFPGGSRLVGEQSLAAIAAAAGIAIPNGSNPTLAEIPNQTVLGGAPLWLGLDGYDPNNGPLTYSVQVSNPGLLQAVIPTGNRSLQIDVAGFGKMNFQLFDHLVPNVTNRMAELTNTGFYNKTNNNTVTFHRVVPNFMIQAGDPTGTGSGGSTLGDFDDQFDLDLQHTSSGLLSMAKAGDDTNDSQFFITDSAQRHLDFNHSIFGRLVEGDSNREAINNTALGLQDPTKPFNANTNPQTRPVSPVVINSMSIFTDTENGALMLKAAEGASGTSSVTVTMTDDQGNTFQRTFQVTVTGDTSNGRPFLEDIGAVQGAMGQQIVLQLEAIDAENSAVFFDAFKPTGETVNYTLNVNNNTGVVTINPPASFTGTFSVFVEVASAADHNDINDFDRQLVQVTVGSAAPTVDLLAASDTGVSNSDDITNASTLQFQVSGVTNGALVKLFRSGSTTPIAEGTATGTTITFNTTALATAGEGTYAITAKQTVGGVESPPSTAVNVTFDTTAPAAFTSTPPTEGETGAVLTYDAQNPGENSAGFRYELVTPPAGATINSTTGILTWTPTVAQVGTQSFGISAIDAAGNVTTQTLSVEIVEPIPPKVAFILEITDLSGNVLTNLSAGQDFLLKVYARDVRNPASGVFSAYLDITWDSTRAVVTGAIQHSTTYVGQPSGDTTTPGLIDEGGALANSLTPIGFGPHEVFRVPMRATGSGTLLFASDLADVPSSHDVLLYGITPGDEIPIEDEEIDFQTVSATIAATFNTVADTFNVNEDSQGTTLNPLANDTNVGGAQNVLTIISVGDRSNGGAVTIASDGKTVIYTPAANFSGTETFTYTARNQNNEENTGTVTVQVQPQNDAPTAVNDAINVPEDSQNFVLDVLANDLTAPDTGETLRVTTVGTGSAGGTLTIGNNGANIRYTPVANFLGTETFTYTISDRTSGGPTSTATVTITVAEANDPPTVVTDSPTVVEDSDFTTINVLANDTTAPDTGETMTVTAVGTGSAGGTIQIGQNGANVRYKPALNFTGIETFTYTVTDSRGAPATGTVSVTVSNTNDPPTSVNDSLTGFKNTPSTFDVLVNDSAAPDPAENLVIDSITQPANGTVEIVENGKKIKFTPVNNFTGTTSFTYIIKDPSGALSAAATATVNVQEFSPSSLAGFVYFDVDNDGAKDAGELPLAGVTITLTGTTTTGSTPVNQTLKTAADGSYKFENLAPGNYVVTQTQPLFTIDGKDTAGSQGGTVANNKITVSNFAQNINGTNNNFGELGRALSTLSIRDLFASNSQDYALAAFDASGAVLWHSMAGGAWQGLSNPKFSIQNGAMLQLAASNGQSQQVQTSVNINTSNKVGLLGSSGGNRLFRLRGGMSNFSFSPVATNQAPTATANSFTTNEDTTLNVAVAQSVLANDTDPESATLTASVVTQPANGTLTFNANGSFTYVPNANFAGTDTFTYRASDGTNQSAAATVTITVTGVNDAPTAVANTYTTAENTALTVAAAQSVLVNDTDPDAGTTLTAEIVTQPANGDITFNANGTFTYTPDEDFTGTDTFTYRAKDATTQSAAVTVTITVTDANDPPTATDDVATVAEDSDFTTLNVLSNDSFAPDTGETLTVSAVGAGTAGGTIEVGTGGANIRYKPAANFAGTETFTYTLSDGRGGTDSGTVTVTVTAANDAPVAGDDTFAVNAGQTLTKDAAAGVLANDDDADNTELTVALGDDVDNGTLTLNDDGGFTYEPDQGFSGTDTFTYTVSDGTLTDTATVTITVNAVPEATDDAYSTDEDAPLVVSAVTEGVVDNDTDGDDDPLTATLVDPPLHGEVTLNGNGTFTYTPDDDFHGSDSFTYKVTDGLADSGLATVTITVDPVNDAPVATDDSFAAEPDGVLTIDAAAGVLANDENIDEDELTVTVGDDVDDGELTLNDDGSFTYTPDAGFTGTDTFTYTVTDDTLTDTATVTIVVNTVPEVTDDDYSTNEDTALVISVVEEGVRANDSDGDGHPLTATLVDPPAHGEVTLNGNGTFTYTPEDDFSGEDTFTYKVNDGLSDSGLATVTITVDPVDDPPVAVDDTYPAVEDTELDVAAATGVLFNDTDLDTVQAELTVTVTTDVQNGTLTLNDDGSFTYTPDEGFTGTDSFTYEVTDGESTDTATVTITVNAAPEGESSAEQALLSYLASQGNGADSLADGHSDWEDAVDEALAELAD